MKIEVKKNKSGEKKNKNKHTSLPESNNSTSDDMTLPEMKKGKKKRKNTDAVVSEVASSDGGVALEKKKKKEKRKFDTESLNNANGTDVKNGNEEFSKKKKKKKTDDDDSTVETAERSEKGKEKKLKKKNKAANKFAHMTPENANLEKEEVKEQQVEKDMLQEIAGESKNNVSFEFPEIGEEVKKKKKKKKVNSEDNLKSEDETRVKKKKAKTEVPDNKVELETLQGESSVVQVRLKKKKKKLDGNETESPQLNVDDDSFLKSRDESAEAEIVATEDRRRKPKKKGKKDKNGQTSLEVSEAEETEPKKKRKKGEKREHPELTCEEAEEHGMETSKKKKKKKSSVREEAQDVSSETSTKKKKAKKEENEQESAQSDAASLTKNSGNIHEVKVSQERNLPSQIEVEQPQKPAKPVGFGQWSTAQFSSSEQQQKFLRLMGGFKKSFQASSESTGGAKMALGKDAQQQLQQGLLGEFERAQSRRLDFNNKGAGLGFTAPSNKKFSIDINATRSVRFDD